MTSLHMNVWADDIIYNTSSSS